MINDYLLNIHNNPTITPRFYFSAAGINSAIICQNQEFLKLLHSRYRCFETRNRPEYELMVYTQTAKSAFPEEIKSGENSYF